MIKEFLQSGNLGALRLGLTRNDVRGLLSDPPDYSENDDIWKYGSLQLTFSENSLSFIGLYFEDGVLHLPSTLVQAGKLTLMETSVESLERLLTGNGIEFTVDKDLTFDDQKTLRLASSQVRVTFSEGQLHSIQLSRS